MVDPIPIENQDGEVEEIVVSSEDVRAQILAQQETKRAIGRLTAAIRGGRLKK